MLQFGARTWGVIVSDQSLGRRQRAARDKGSMERRGATRPPCLLCARCSGGPGWLQPVPWPRGPRPRAAQGWCPRVGPACTTLPHIRGCVLLGRDAKKCCGEADKGGSMAQARSGGGAHAWARVRGCACVLCVAFPKQRNLLGAQAPLPWKMRDGMKERYRVRAGLLCTAMPWDEFSHPLSFIDDMTGRRRGACGAGVRVVQRRVLQQVSPAAVSTRRRGCVCVCACVFFIRTPHGCILIRRVH
ncbi:MAG: hypothetical protein J3K34DRAFT_401397 [Monoraphidium minutum]|nr:MAG: hypothetical protein J3K34DRAFT_401397 [Monoraphidium minutum]